MPFPFAIGISGIYRYPSSKQKNRAREQLFFILKHIAL
jgi:hypothetical protein